MSRTLTVRRACGVVAILAAIGALALVVTGGYEFTIAGLRIRGRGPDRLAMLAVAAAAAFFLLGGRTWVPTDEDLARLPRAGVFVLMLSIATGVVTFWFGSRAAGGSDSYSYLSQAHLWFSGSARQPQAWAAAAPWPDAAESFVPLGYTLLPDGVTTVSVVSPGFPLLIALAMTVASAGAVSLVLPILAALMIWATYGLGRALASDWAGLAAAWLVATNATFIYMSMQLMSDLPTAVAWTAAFCFAARGRPASAFAAGLAVAVAILIRVNLAPLAIILAGWFAFVDWRGRTGDGFSPRNTMAFLVGTAPAVIAIATINWQNFGSVLTTGYGSTDGVFKIANLLPNLRLYSRWFTEVSTPLIWVGVAAVLLPFRAIWPREAGRAFVPFLAAFSALLWTEYCLYLLFDVWWYLRFLLPALPIVTIGMGQVAVAAAAHRPPLVRVAAAVLLLALGVHGVVDARDRYVFNARVDDSRYHRAGRAVAEATEPSSVVFSIQHSGSLRYYSGRMTLRFDYMDPAWLERAVQWLASQGAHPYALLETWEVDAWRRQFGSGSALARLDFQPVRAFPPGDQMALYDLLAPGPDEPAVVTPSAIDLDFAASAPQFVPLFAQTPR